MKATKWIKCERCIELWGSPDQTMGTACSVVQRGEWFIIEYRCMCHRCGFDVLPMEKPRFDVRVCDELGNELFCGAGDSEFEAKAAAAASFLMRHKRPFMVH